MESNEIKYIGVNDHYVDLFEGQYPVKNGMSYNSYLIIDEKIAVIDSVDTNFLQEWLENINHELKGKEPDYLVIHHMEPDHSANIFRFSQAYKKTIIVASEKAFMMMKQFFGVDYSNRRIIVQEGDTLNLGKHQLTFITAPMVHWPEVLMSYESSEKILFSADAFGKFGALDVADNWLDEARRYYFGIVGKYGIQVQNVLKKAKDLDIRSIYPLHGPILNSNLNYYLDLYNTWSTYEYEKDGIVIAYTSIYGNTKKVVDLFIQKLLDKGEKNILVYDLARCDLSEVVSMAFCYSKLILATTTYNAGIFPYMRNFINHLVERNYCNRMVGIIENGSWSPTASKVIKGMFANSKKITFYDNIVTIKSAIDGESENSLDNLVSEICIYNSYQKDHYFTEVNDPKALFNIGYGLYLVTSKDGNKDNGIIINTVFQVTNNPDRVVVAINKANYSYEIITKTGIMNVNCLTVDTPFKVFETFGFHSGRDIDKFASYEKFFSNNGLVFLPKYINSFISLTVENYLDLGTHGMFICTVTESHVISKRETMTYNYYQQNVKPKPEVKGKKGFICKVCGYIYEGETLPEDFICPLCKHGASDFEPIE